MIEANGNLFAELEAERRQAPMKPYVPPPPRIMLPTPEPARPDEELPDEDEWAALSDSQDPFGAGEERVEPPGEEQAAAPVAATAEESAAQLALLAVAPDGASYAAAAPDIRSALRLLREHMGSLPRQMRDAADVILARLEPEYEELIRIYVHFEHASDISDLGKILGAPLTSAVRSLRYLRDRVVASAVDDAGEQPRAGREKTFADLQTGLFGVEEWWEPLWAGMPEFTQLDLAPVYSIEMEFTSWDDVDHFEEVVGQTVPRGPRRTPSIWFPEAEIGRIAGRAWVDKTDARWKQEAV